MSLTVAEMQAFRRIDSGEHESGDLCAVCRGVWGDHCGALCPGEETVWQSVESATLKQQASRLDAADKLVERLVLRLREIRIAYAMNPSCQRGVIDDCCCVKCANAATDEALAEAAKWREGK